MKCKYSHLFSFEHSRMIKDYFAPTRVFSCDVSALDYFWYAT